MSVNQPEDLLVAFSGRDRASFAMAQSLLDGAGIRYIVSGDKAQDLFGWGRIGLGYNPALGAPRILVKREDYDAAKEMLLDIEALQSRRPPLILRIAAVLMIIGVLVGLIYSFVEILMDRY